jgi:uncharacterized protein (TIGR02001 family)
MSRSIAVMVLALATSTASSAGLEGRLGIGVSLGSDYQYQGIRQDRGGTSVAANIQYEHGEHWVAGAWIGEYEVPWYRDASLETDYFLAYRAGVSFNHRIETSLWHYDYHDPAYDHYDWTQMLMSYHYSDMLTLTLGAADGFLDTPGTSLLIEGTLRRHLGPVSIGVSAGKHHLPGESVSGFTYVQFGGTAQWRKWTLAAHYTLPQSATNYTTQRLAHKGVSMVLGYRHSFGAD